jgi:hypothetical protein
VTSLTDARSGCSCSDGASIARGYVVARPPSPVPILPGVAPRVVIVDPRRVATLRVDRPTGGGPRAPQQIHLPKRPTGIELPDGRPLTKAQRVYIDAELIEQWTAERPRATGARNGVPPRD